jgi:hypothetical protein
MEEKSRTEMFSFFNPYEWTTENLDQKWPAILLSKHFCGKKKEFNKDGSTPRGEHCVHCLSFSMSNLYEHHPMNRLRNYDSLLLSHINSTIK